MKTTFLIMHLIGIALGAGGAFMSDALFFYFFKKESFDERALRILRLGSRMVWIGLLVLVISGVALFAFNADRYLHSSKFITKMVVVLVIAINGLVFHKVHLPNLARGIFKRSLFVSGAISMTSWILTIVLGALRSIALPSPLLIGAYLVVLWLASLAAVILYPRLMRGRQ